LLLPKIDLLRDARRQSQQGCVAPAPTDQLHPRRQARAVRIGKEMAGWPDRLKGRTSRVSGTTARASAASSSVGGTMGNVGRTSASASCNRASISAVT
jgi:hypothetical protein